MRHGRWLVVVKPMGNTMVTFRSEVNQATLSNNFNAVLEIPSPSNRISSMLDLLRQWLQMAAYHILILPIFCNRGPTGWFQTRFRHIRHQQQLYLRAHPPEEMQSCHFVHHHTI
jgi:hypothetical protein